MHQLKTRVFQRWQKKSGITDAALLVALAEMQAGLIDADLGGGVVKKRVALAGRGKSGGARTLLATNKGSRWIFVYGFEKPAGQHHALRAGNHPDRGGRVLGFD